MVETWAVVIDTPDYEQTIWLEFPDGQTEDTVREYAMKRWTVYEIWKEDDEDLD